MCEINEKLFYRNFIATNSKFHTSLACVVLSQSGLYSTAILLAMMRGACLDVFSCLVGATDQVLGKKFVKLPGVSIY